MSEPWRRQMHDTLRQHGSEYMIEAAGLGLFMLAACGFGTLLEYPLSPVRQETRTIHTCSKANADHGSAIWGSSERIEGAPLDDNR